MLIAWVALPVVLGLLSVGAGLLVERAAGYRLPGTVVVPLGFAALVCVTQLTLLVVAPATPWVALVVALAGLWLGRARLRGATVDRWAVAMAVLVYVAFAAPAVLVGEPTFLGYSNLGDAAVHFELVDRLMGHGASVAGLPPSTYQLSLFNYFATAYPTGGHGVLGTVRTLLGIDVAWAFQPYLAAMAAILSLALLSLLRGVTRRPWLAAGAAGLAAQASLAYSYAQDQQAIKELATLVTLVTLVALVAPLVARRPTWRTGLPLAVAAGGALGVLSVAVAPWAGPVLLVALALVIARHRRGGAGPIVAQVLVFAVVGALFALPVLSRLNAFVATNTVTLQAAQEFGNLSDPLVFVQALGVWPTSDFRLPLLDTGGLAVLLVGAAALAALLGAVAVFRHRAWSVVLLVAVSGIGFWVVAGRASPWAYGKALMLLSPVILLLAGFAVVAAWERGRRAEALAVAVALLVGVGWTNALTYRGVDPAPHDRLSELQRIGDRFAGQGPLAYFEFEEFSKHFLRDSDPTGATESFKPAGLEPSGYGEIRFGYSSDLDAWTPASLARYRLLVVRRGPTTSRPPSGWSRAYRGTDYDVWRRDADAPEVLAHIGAGSRFDGGGPVDCEAVRGLAATAREAGGRLAYVPRPELGNFQPALFALPGNWAVDGTDGSTIRPTGRGRVSGTLTVPEAGRYRLWLEASLTRTATIVVDGGRPIELDAGLNPRQSEVAAGAVTLDAGEHRVSVELAGGSLAPGDAGGNRLLGPLYLTPAADPGAAPVRTVAPARWRSACAGTVDWVEVVR